MWVIGALCVCVPLLYLNVQSRKKQSANRAVRLNHHDTNADRT
jgi:hypothetical protein